MIVQITLWPWNSGSDILSLSNFFFYIRSKRQRATRILKSWHDLCTHIPCPGSEAKCGRMLSQCNGDVFLWKSMLSCLFLLCNKTNKKKDVFVDTISEVVLGSRAATFFLMHLSSEVILHMISLIQYTNIWIQFEM